MGSSSVTRTVAVLAFLVALTGCQVTVQAGVDLRTDGGGWVRAGVGLDAEAARAVPDLAAQLRVDDLRQAGWTVVGPRREDDGLTWVRASKPFSTPAGAATAFSQLGGPDGPFGDFRVSRQRSLFRGRTAFSGVVDLTDGLAGLADPELRRTVGDALSLDPAGLRRLFGPDADRSVHVEVVARLPGSVHASGADRVGGAVVWRPALGQRLRLEASAESFEPVPVVPAAVAVVAAGTAVVLVLRRRTRTRRALRQPDSLEGEPAPGAVSAREDPMS